MIEASRAVRHIGPTWSSDHASGTTPAVLMAPYVGLNPVMPQSAAGRRIDPPVSEPSAAKHNPAATATADPPELPPGDRRTSQGLRLVPNELVSPVKL